MDFWTEKNLDFFIQEGFSSVRVYCSDTPVQKRTLKIALEVDLSEMASMNFSNSSFLQKDIVSACFLPIDPATLAGLEGSL